MEKLSAVTLVRSIPRMHAHVVIAANGHRYFVKSPLPGYCEGRAVMGLKIAAACGVSAVEPAQVVFDEEFVNRFTHNSAPQPSDFMQSIHVGTFLGTRYPDNPDCTFIWDMIPFKHASQIRNLLDFSIMRMVDCWTANASPGRAIFVRQPEKDLIAYMLGFGRCFSFGETDIPANFNLWLVAPLFTAESWQATEETVDLIRKITNSDLETMAGNIPSDWWKGTAGSTEIIEMLLRRQANLDPLLTALRRSEPGLAIRMGVRAETSLAVALKQSA